jgi:hypothetical protein
MEDVHVGRDTLPHGLNSEWSLQAQKVCGHLLLLKAGRSRASCHSCVPILFLLLACLPPATWRPEVEAKHGDHGPCRSSSMEHLRWESQDTVEVPQHWQGSSPGRATGYPHPATEVSAGVRPNHSPDRRRGQLAKTGRQGQREAQGSWHRAATFPTIMFYLSQAEGRRSSTRP